MKPQTEKQRRKAPSKEKAQGRATRYRGGPCAKCGTTERYTSSRACVQCYAVAREQQKLQRPHTTFIGEVCSKHPEAGGLRRSRRGGVCVECNREHKRSPAFQAVVLAWREKNPGRYKSAAHARAGLRRARKRNVTDESAEAKQVFAELSREARCWGLTIDHSVPLAGCRVCGARGRHEPDNLRLMSPSDNSSKGNRCMSCWSGSERD